MKNRIYPLLFLLISLSANAQKVHTTLTQHWVDDAWHDTFRETYIYTGNGLLDTKTEQRWDASTGTWVNSRRHSYAYNSDTTLKQDLTQIWDPIAKAWQNSALLSNTYGSPGHVTEVLTQNWVNGGWQNSLVIKCTLNKHGNWATSLKQTWDTVSGLWVNVVRAKYAYNNKGKLDSWLALSWDASKKAWTKNKEGRNTLAYNESSKFIGNVDQVRLNGHWMDNVRSVHTYDGKGYETSEIGQIWDAKSNSWIETLHRDFTNNSDGSISYCIAERWNKTDEKPLSKLKVSYTYL